MDPIYTEEMLAMSASLTEMAVKGTASAVTTKIRSIKNEKNAERIRETYDEIISELLAEREEAIRIAQTYKFELDRIAITDEDIEHLHKTVTRLVEIFKDDEKKQGDSDNVNEDSEEPQNNGVEETSVYEQIKELISPDTLKTIQLIGFNYKEAIGEPLTQIVRNLILSKGGQSDSNTTLQSIITPEMVELLKNEKAYKNFKDFIMEMNA